MFEERIRNLENLNEVNLNDDNSSEIQAQIEVHLKNYFSESMLPDFFYPHIAGMIKEDLPQSTQELHDLIGDFIRNGSKIKPSRSFEISNLIFEELKKLNLIKAEQNRFHLAAEKLNAPVTMHQVKLIEEQETNSEYQDLFRGVKRGFNTNDDIDEEAMKKKRKDKDPNQKMKE
jgi:hypothetical protein